MSNIVYYRIVGHLVILYCLTVPLLDVNDLLEEHKKVNPDVKVFADLQTRFATIWNVGFQLLYASTALVIDLSAILKKERLIPVALKNYRHIFFAGIIFPIACGIQIFWAVYFYDRELVFKRTIEVVISQKINVIVHTAVLLYAFWELIFLPKDQPERNNLSWKHLQLFNLAYILTTLYTRYVDVGIWPYIVLGATTGTMMFPVIFFSLWYLSTLGYYLQWHIKSLAWHFRTLSKSSRKKPLKIKAMVKSELIYYQLTAHLTMGTLLVVSLMDIGERMPKLLITNPELKMNNQLAPRYYTLWNVFLQLLYYPLATICDVAKLLDNGGPRLTKLHKFRQKAFHEVVFPIGFGVCMFWPIYFYDRELILPTHLTNLVMSQFTNVLMHGLVIIYVFWELALLPSDLIKRDELKIKYWLTISLGYLFLTLWTRFVDLGIWPYEVLKYAQGLMFYIILFSVLIHNFVGFYTQWTIKDCLSNVVNDWVYGRKLKKVN